MKLQQILLPLALAGGALSHAIHPLEPRSNTCVSNACLQKVTGLLTLPLYFQREVDCINFQSTPSATVPSYASACSNPAAYSSACACWGFPGKTTPTASATPTPTATCLSESDATGIVNDFINLLVNTQSNFNTTLANQLLADGNFTDVSDSIDYLAGIPMGSVTFGSKSAFISGAGTQPPFPSITTLNIFYTCNVITWRYQLNTTPWPVRGIDVFVTTPSKQIQTVYAEMNSGAFLANVGSPECQPGWAPSIAQ